jgi:two-component system OmpR family response regulator
VQHAAQADRRAGVLTEGAEGEPTVELDEHRVLVVEDDPALREIYAGALRGFGHDVRTASDGAAALDTLTNGWRPCVVFLDLRMPGMDGWEFSRRLREDGRYQAVRVVVVAAHFRIDQEAADIGADGWLQKPFDLVRLDEETRNLCAS